MNKSANPPVVLSISTLDPSGSGGVQADIETAASLGSHCAPIISALCTEALTSRSATVAVDSTLLIEQARSVLEVLDVRAIKIGFLGSVANVEAVHSILNDFAHIPSIVQPALCLWNEDDPEQTGLIDALATLLLPESFISCMSLFEARYFVEQSDTIDASAHAILSLGCENLLITGTGKNHLQFQNSFYCDSKVEHMEWMEEAPSTHGGSSTLTMSIASYIAHGFTAKQAIKQGLHFTLQAMMASRDMGLTDNTLHRFFWADKNINLKKSGTKSGH